MKAATFENVKRALDLDLIRVSKDGRIEGKRPTPKGRWIERKLEPVKGPHHTTHYHRTSFMVEGKRYRILVHRLVWFVFNGPIPDHLTVNHINGEKTDNRLENLELLTMSESISHAFKIGTQPKQKDRRQFFSDEQVREIRSSPGTYEQIAERFGVSLYTIGRIKRGETYSWN